MVSAGAVPAVWALAAEKLQNANIQAKKFL
jgi:hypothetical protein